MTNRASGNPNGNPKGRLSRGRAELAQEIWRDPPVGTQVIPTRKQPQAET